MKRTNECNDTIINDVIKGTANAADVSDVVRWFATEEGQEFLSDDIDQSIASILNKEDAMAGAAASVPSDKMLRHINHTLRMHRIRRVALRIAAVCIPLVAVAAFLFYGRQPAEPALIEAYVPKGRQQQITFEDGSYVYLNADSRLRYPERFAADARKVSLEGEGYFVITKNPGRPFIVETKSGAIHVLGTSFNVEAYPKDKNMTLQLDRGSIKLTTETRQEYLMEPGERLVYNRENKQCDVAPTDNPPMLSKWENNLFSFHKAKLRRVLDELAHWYDVDFQIEDTRALEFSFTFDAGKDSLDDILTDMEKVSPVRFAPAGKTVKVSLK